MGRTPVFLFPFEERDLGDRVFGFAGSSDDPHDGRTGFLTYLRGHLRDAGYDLHTADLLLDGEVPADVAHVSFLNDWDCSALVRRRGCVLGSWYTLEPPIYNRPDDRFHRLPEIARRFRRIYSLASEKGILAATGLPGIPHVRTIGFPSSHEAVIEELWGRADRRPMVMIATALDAPSAGVELYSERVRAVRHFGARAMLDLYGAGWRERCGIDGARRGPVREVVAHPRSALRRIWSGRRIDALYRSARPAIAACHRGRCARKLETLAGYTFALCYENSSVDGYISEKVFDCLAVGAIPIYLGAPDVLEWLPANCFVDRRAFRTDADLEEYIVGMPPASIAGLRDAGRAFFRSRAFERFSRRTFAERYLRDVEEDLSAVRPGELVAA